MLKIPCITRIANAAVGLTGIYREVAHQVEVTACTVAPGNWTTSLSYSGGPEEENQWRASGKPTRRRSKLKSPWRLSKGDRTINELAGHYGVHPTLIHG